MLDRTIPFYNTILKCVNYEHKNEALPKGFSIVSYKNGYEKSWAELEFSIGDFDSLEDAESYFFKTYLQEQDLRNNILFLLNSDNAVILFLFAVIKSPLLSRKVKLPSFISISKILS